MSTDKAKIGPMPMPIPIIGQSLMSCIAIFVIEREDLTAMTNIYFTIYFTNTAGNIKLVLDHFKYRSWRLLKTMEQVYSINEMIRKLPCNIPVYLAQQDVFQGAIWARWINTEGTHGHAVHMIRTISARYNLRPPHRCIRCVKWRNTVGTDIRHNK